MEVCKNVGVKLKQGFLFVITWIKRINTDEKHIFRSLATADPSLVAQTSSFLAAARAESDNAKKPKTSGFLKPKDDD